MNSLSSSPVSYPVSPHAQSSSAPAPFRVLLFFALSGGSALAAAAPSPVDSDLATRAEAILRNHCYECHSHSADKIKAGLLVDGRAAMLQGGDSGPVIVPGDPDSSLLIQAVRYTDVDLEMPPKTRLPDEDIALLEEWVRQDAPWTASAVDAPKSGGEAEFNLEQRRREHWAWQPVVQPEPPAAVNSNRPADAVDAFIRHRLESAGLQPAPEADRRTLSRRLSLILTGLPPSPEHVARFEADSDDDAYEREVDRLLDSPHFGERWARHWLDVVRYAETLGHEFDYELPNAWRYRDYLIRAFNDDLPYDDFVREHLAGDLLDPPRVDRATGLNESAVAPAFHWFGQQVHSPVDVKAYQLEVIDNQIDTLSKAFQAMTVSCARCHDHKFDAISTKDFYALYGVMESSRYRQIDLTPKAARDKQLAALKALRREIEKPFHLERTDRDAAGLNPALVDWYRDGAALEDALVQPGDILFTGPTNPVVRAETTFLSSRKLSTRLEGALHSPTFVVTNRYVHLRVAGGGARARIVIENFNVIRNPIYGDLNKRISNEAFHWLTFDLDRWRGRRAYVEILDQVTPGLGGTIAPNGFPADAWFDLAEVRFTDQRWVEGAPESKVVKTPNEAMRPLERLAEFERTLAPAPRAPSMTEGDGVDEHVFIRGNSGRFGDLVPRRYLEALGGLEHPVDSGSGRLDLAERVLSPDNPLTARVWVNRVWHHLFGRGLVPTVDDFGVLGDRPTHPELLDWLAHWFMTEGEWSTKKLVRMLVTTRAWRQSAEPRDPEFSTVDPTNELLHKWSVRRLEGEVIRDSILAVSGRLDPRLFGPSVPVHLTDFMTGRGRPNTSGPLDGDGRRSIYVETRRNFPSPMMVAFDTPQAAQTFGRRARSNVPAQALILMNDPFVHEQAARFAGRLTKETADRPLADRVHRLYQQAFQREPTADELEQCLAFLNSAAAVARESIPQERKQAHERPSSETTAANNKSSEPSAPETATRGMDFRATELEAWADLCHVLFNTKEFVFVN